MILFMTEDRRGRPGRRSGYGAGTVKNGTRIAKALVEEKLAACVNIIPAVRSVYRWEDNVCDDPESLLWIKTKKALLPRIQERVKALHSYDLPEVIAMDITGGLPEYLEWVAQGGRSVFVRTRIIRLVRWRDHVCPKIG